MIAKRLEDIEEADLQQLMESGVTERKTLEYKQQLPNSSSGDKISFLSHVSSLANTDGGDLLFGTVENRDTGGLKEIIGLDVQNVDQERLTLEHLIRDGTAPRIQGYDMKWVNLSDSKKVLVIRVKKSWIGPHMVSLNDHGRFYGRNSGGRFIYDVSNLRAAFNQSGDYPERAIRFRNDRILSIASGEAPMVLHEGAKIILHLIPLSAFSQMQEYNIEDVYAKNPKPIYVGGWDRRYNFDGVLTYATSPDRESQREMAHSYFQFFRNGVVEAVECSMLGSSDGRRFIPYVTLETRLLESTRDYLDLMKTIGIVPPIYLLLTLSGVAGYEMPVPRSRCGHYRPQGIDRDVLKIPNVVIEDYAADLNLVLKPVFDSIWNACGWSRSFRVDWDS